LVSIIHNNSLSILQKFRVDSTIILRVNWCFDHPFHCSLSIRDFNTPLHHAAFTGKSTCKDSNSVFTVKGNAAIVSLLLASGADPEKKNLEGNTALLLSASSPGIVTTVLLEKGANVNAANENGDTFLHLAARVRFFRTLNIYTSLLGLVINQSTEIKHIVDTMALFLSWISITQQTIHFQYFKISCV
jgi:ankyrin repeat protein